MERKVDLKKYILKKRVTFVRLCRPRNDRYIITTHPALSVTPIRGIASYQEARPPIEVAISRASALCVNELLTLKFSSPAGLMSFNGYWARRSANRSYSI